MSKSSDQQRHRRLFNMITADYESIQHASRLAEQASMQACKKAWKSVLRTF
jgi:hypothetical protein